MAEDIYRQNILDHYHSPKWRGRLEPADIQVSESNSLCGDTVSLSLRLDNGGRIMEVAWEGDGCAISLAAADILSSRFKYLWLNLRDLERTHRL